jgi:class 3 adenylate cyclase
MDEIHKTVGPDVSLLIGINTGGSLVGGIMNARRPLFQLLGTAVELARALAETRVSGQLHMIRSVYEHVYSHNFKVTERGDTKLRGGKSVHSYLITP